MKKFLLSSLLGVFLLGFGGIGMAVEYYNLSYYCSESSAGYFSQIGLNPLYSNGTTNLNTQAPTTDPSSCGSHCDCPNQNGLIFVGWKIDDAMYNPGDSYTFPSLTTKNAYAQWEEPAPVNYNLWVGNTRVTSQNKDNVLGDGKVSFDPDTNVLSFDNATINTYSSIESEKNYDKLNAAIRSKLGTLTISGNVNLPVEVYSIYATDDIVTNGGNLVVNGNINNYSELRIFGDLNVISGSIISSTHGSIWCYNNLTFGSNVSMIDLPHGIHAANSITLENPLGITSPANGEIVHSSSWYGIGDYSTRAVVQPVTKITNISITGIKNPVLGETPTTSGLVVTSTPANAINLDTELVPYWRAKKNDYRDGISSKHGSNFSRARPPFKNEPDFYFIRIIFTPVDGYVLAENYTVTADSGYDSILTGVNDHLLDGYISYKSADGLNYIHIRYLTENIPSPTTISAISINGVVTPVGGATPTLEGIESQTEGITVSNRNTIGNTSYDLIRCSVDTDPILCGEDLPKFVAGSKYNLYVPFTVDNGYALANSFTATDGTNNAIETDGDIKRVVFQYTATEPTASYNITYHLDGGTNHTDNPSTYGTLTEAITLKEPTKDGNYVFGGWYSDADFTTEVTEISVGATGDKDFYAKWIEGKEETIPRGTTAEVGTHDITTVITNENAPEISAVKSSDIATKGKTATVRGGIKISARKNGTIIFSKPFKVKFKVKGASKIRVKVRHGNSAFGFDGLVSEADGECDTTNGKASSKAYKGEELSVDNEGNVTIYTCSASTFIAYTEETPSSNTSSSSGGGGSHKTVKTEANTGDVENETKVDETKDEEKTENTTEKSEFEQAYEFAYENGITTMKTIEEADMNSPLTRIAMAKMLSQYAINILGKKPANIVVPSFPDVDEKLDDDYNNGVTLAYQLGIMGIGIDNFRPFDLVTRAEFATALSRLLYGTEDGTDNYYSTHLAKLMEDGIITNNDPSLQEVRGYIMIMLMRSAKNKDLK